MLIRSLFYIEAGLWALRAPNNLIGSPGLSTLGRTPTQISAAFPPQWSSYLVLVPNQPISMYYLLTTNLY